MPYILLALLFFIPHAASAHIPEFVAPLSEDVLIPIAAPDVSHAYYGTLQNFPHTYVFTTDRPLDLRVSLLVPDVSFANNNISGIIVRDNGNGSVSEVTRLFAKDAPWSSFYEPWGGDSYRQGPTYDATVTPGTYHIEVSTPDNVGPYVLVVGTKEENGSLGYLETVRRIAQIKVFFGKSQFLVIESPFIYVPLLCVLLAAAAWWYYRKRTSTRVSTD